MMMRGLGGADETVKRNIQTLVHVAEPAGVAFGEFGRRHAFGGRGLDHLLAVLVGTGQEEHVLAVEPLEARQRVGRNRLIGVTDMRLAVRISDRCGDEVGVALGRRRGRRRRFGRGLRRPRRNGLWAFFGG